MEKMNDGVLSGRLQQLYKRAKELEYEIQSIDSITNLQERLENIQEYRFSINDYKAQYNQIAEQLALFTDVPELLEFIVDFSIRTPEIILELARRINLSQGFFNIPERTAKKTNNSVDIRNLAEDLGRELMKGIKAIK